MKRQPRAGDPLTTPELVVLRLASEGLTKREAAARISRGYETIKHHHRSAKRKLGARNATHAVAIALREGLFE